MKLSDIQKKKKGALKSKIVTIRTTASSRAFMRKHKISPTKLFNKTLDKLRKIK